jgi:hypothetical protein
VSHFVIGKFTSLQDLKKVILRLITGAGLRSGRKNRPRKNFQCDIVNGLIHLHRDPWLFGGVYKILGVGKTIRKILIFTGKSRL